MSSNIIEVGVPQVLVQASNPSNAISSTPANVGPYTTNIDTTGSWNASTGVFTVVFPGKYFCAASFLIAGTYALNQATQVLLIKNGNPSQIASGYSQSGGAQTAVEVDLEFEVDCITGDTLNFQILSGATSPAYTSGPAYNYIMINLIK